MNQSSTARRIAIGAAVSGLLYAVGMAGAIGQGQSVPTAPPVAPTRQPSLIPLDGVWTIDPMHTNINFAVRHMVVSQIRGRFNEFSGTIVANTKEMSKSSVQFTIQAASVDTGVPARDGHIKGEEFFDVAKYPEITFQSSRIKRKSGTNYVAQGTFTMRGVARPISFPFQLNGPVKDSFGAVRFGLQAKLKINRQDYGVKWNQTLDNGGLAVSNDVDIELNVEAVPAKKEEKTTSAR